MIDLKATLIGLALLFLELGKAAILTGHDCGQSLRQRDGAVTVESEQQG